jgi:3-dehydroquinate dehydratase
VIEVHLSNPTARGTTSVMLPVCKACVYGFGIESYKFALTGLKSLIKK